MAALAFALHILGAVVWVGGMFAIYVCLRPALVTLETPQRLQLMRATFQKFFPWVWIAILLLLASGYWMLFTTFGGFAGAGLHVRTYLDRVKKVRLTPPLPNANTWRRHTGRTAH
jgi:uncharacterized membrane protein